MRVWAHVVPVRCSICIPILQVWGNVDVKSVIQIAWTVWYRLDMPMRIEYQVSMFKCPSVLRCCRWQLQLIQLGLLQPCTFSPIAPGPRLALLFAWLCSKPVQKIDPAKILTYTQKKKKHELFCCMGFVKQWVLLVLALVFRLAWTLLWDRVLHTLAALVSLFVVSYGLASKLV